MSVVSLKHRRHAVLLFVFVALFALLGAEGDCGGPKPDPGVDAGITACGDGYCATSQTCCNDVCVDTQRDSDNCGACGAVCDGLCNDGECCADCQLCGAEVCSAGQGCCNYACVDFQSDEENCGACGKSCGEHEQCLNGQCICGDSEENGSICSSAQTCCPAPGGFDCTYTSGDISNCGACNNPCNDTEACVQGLCVCPSEDGSYLSCTSEETCLQSLGCINLQTDPRHCGAAEVACGPGEQCINGACTCGSSSQSGGAVCDEDQSCCGEPASCKPLEQCLCGSTTCQAQEFCCEDLVDGHPVPRCSVVEQDSRNCGACGHSCMPGQVCDDGRCTCQYPVLDCNGNPSDGCETSVWTDPANCGACGRACPAGEVCDGHGGCVLNCPAPLSKCDGQCVDYARDRDNCGACGAACAPGEVCDGAGNCELSCQQGLTNCFGICRDVNTDSRHCGSCGQTCGAGEICDGSGQCALNCLPSLSECDSRCQDLSSDRLNCGACGNACEPGEICNGQGSCATTCAAGYSECFGACHDLNTNRLHCGACGQACAAGQICNGAGHCALSCQEGLSNCHGRCVDVQRDEDHCGGCAVRCAAGELCREGLCESACSVGGDAGVPEAGQDDAQQHDASANDGGDDAASPGDAGFFDSFVSDAAQSLHGQAVFQVSTGEAFACAALIDQTIWCWGDNSLGQLGNAQVLGWSASAVPVNGLPADVHEVLALKSAAAHSCAILEVANNRTELYCWGANASGQLGQGHSNVVQGAVLVTLSEDPDPSPYIVAVGSSATGPAHGHSCAAIGGYDQGLYCWGENRHGQLAHGVSGSAEHLPGKMFMNVGYDFEQLAAGEDSTCFVTSYIEDPYEYLSCVGNNAFGQSGDADGNISATDFTVDTDSVAGAKQIVGLRAGRHHFCALFADSNTAPYEMRCWGRNDHGQLGRLVSSNGEDELATVIALPSGLMTADALPVLGPDMSALASDCALYAWGGNTDSLLAGSDQALCPSSVTARLESYDGPLFEGIQGISNRATHHLCAIDANSRVRCWGNNDKGQLGKSGPNLSFVPDDSIVLPPE